MPEEFSWDVNPAPEHERRADTLNWICVPEGTSWTGMGTV